MRWSWRIGSIAGIPLYIHATFLLIIVWVAVAHWMSDQSVAGTVLGVLFVLALFACVVLHELGHALAARRYNIRTRDITLLPIGGLARLERMPDKPSEELRVALAGPAVNVAIAGLLYMGLQLTTGLGPLSRLSVVEGSFFQRLMIVNVFLVLFNLLPAFPMDGGRVLRAILATRLDYVRATQVASTVGQAMALLFGFVGFFTNPFLIFIALFVWIGAAQESSMVQMRSSLAGIPVNRAMLTDFETLQATDTLEDAVRLILAGSQQDFPVYEHGRLAGVLTRADLVKALAQKPGQTPVADAMRRDFQIVDAHEMLESAFSKLNQCACNTLPVTRDGQLVGLLTTENFGEFMMIQAALGAASRGSRQAA